MTSTSAIPPGGQSRALALGLKLLGFLGAERRPVSLGELATHAGSGKPSVLRLLRTLERLGYVARDGNNQYLAAGDFWPNAADREMPFLLRKAAAEFCHNLHDELGETVSLACLFEDHVRVIDVLESPHHIRMTNFPGRILQPYASALGKAVAAFQDEEQARRLLHVYGIYRLTPNTLTDQAAISAEFETVRALGYAVDDEETVDGGYCLGAPVHSPGGRVIAAVSVSTPKFRISEPLLEHLPQAVKGVAEKIGAALSSLASAASEKQA